jgi:hypothetical protein
LGKLNCRPPPPPPPPKTTIPFSYQNYRFSKTVLYIINRKIHGCLELPDLFLVFNMIYHLFNTLYLLTTLNISIQTMDCNNLQNSYVLRIGERVIGWVHWGGGGLWNISSPLRGGIKYFPGWALLELTYK